MSRLVGYDADGLPLAVDDPEHDRIVESTMSEITAGTRVWRRSPVEGVIDGELYFRPAGTTVRRSDEVLIDHPALPFVAAELARQGEGAVAVVMHRDSAEWLVRLLEHWGYIDMPLEVRRQLDGQGGGA